MKYCTTLYYMIWYHIISCHIAWYDMILYSDILFYDIWYYGISFHIILYYIILYFIRSYFITITHCIIYTYPYIPATFRGEGGAFRGRLAVQPQPGSSQLRCRVVAAGGTVHDDSWQEAPWRNFFPCSQVSISYRHSVNRNHPEHGIDMHRIHWIHWIHWIHSPKR